MQRDMRPGREIDPIVPGCRCGRRAAPSSSSRSRFHTFREVAQRLAVCAVRNLMASHHHDRQQPFDVRRPVRGGSAGTSPAAVGYSAALGWARRAGRRRGGLGALRTRTRHATAGCWSSTGDAARLRASSTNCRGTGWCSRIALSRSILEVLLQRGLDQPCSLHIHVGLQHRPA